MVGASKILTVSYGTFSCTLEGFDDPFNTMKAIAEYFRDLAADDRYFGAEPPQPDAAMLHRIAEREVQRRVEARVEENGVVLRAGAEGQAAGSTPAPRPAPPQAPDDSMVAPMASLAARQKADPAPATPQGQQTEAGPTATQAGAVSDSVAAKLQRLRQAVTVSRASGETTRPPQNLAAMLAAAEIEEAETAASDGPDEADRLATVKAEAERIAAEQAEAERLAAEKAEAERIAAEQAEAERLAAEKAEAERVAAEQAEAGRLAAEKAEAERLATEQAEAERLAAEKARVAEAQAKADRLAAEAAAEIERMAAIDADDGAETTGAKNAPATAPALSLPTSAGAEADNDEADSDAAEEAALLAQFLTDTPDSPPPAPEDAAAQAADGAIKDKAEADSDLVADLTAGPADVGSGLPEAALVPTSFGEDFATDQGEDPLTIAMEPAEDAATAGAETAEQDLDGATPDAKLLQATGEITTTPDDTPEPVADLSAALPPATARTEAADHRATEAEAAPDTAGTDHADGDGTDTDNAGTGDAPQDAASLMARAKRARARVIRIRRVDAPARPDAPTRPDALPPVADSPAPAEPLAGDESAAQAPVQPRRPVMPRRPRPDAAQDEDASVKRLIDQTNTELDGPENRRRLSAIAHLKAAVATTVADRKAGLDTRRPSDESRISPYRTDLERAMRPRAAQPGDQPVAPPVERPAPLVLVSEQRIDRPASRPAAEDTSAAPMVTPMRPHRVMGAGNLAMQMAKEDFEEDEEQALSGAEIGTIFDPQLDFAGFAEGLGAISLPELLEAAAAYAHCAEGQDSMTRPHIVRHVTQLRPELADRREDMLSVFGVLLREGRIEKVGRGQFALNADAPALAEGRKLIEGDSAE
ncbi:hypothetical protein [Szabonella alba]|uniref:Lipoprotein n=1 Tax=Szabonella alba TaxID=2804194 RepID=A0A8K0VB28_9RHOB|nr:hypothetical protein [Szabonella alba]MBL4915987.1 hypothetical protein [Szabonella alba]